MRVISLVPSMRRVAAGLLASIPGLGAVVGMIAVILYVFAVMATKLFGARFPEWFGTLGESAYTLFQVMTLESWSMGIVRPVMEVFPYAWIFFCVVYSGVHLHHAQSVHCSGRKRHAKRKSR
jgi:voltage-gated sodium channel